MSFSYQLYSSRNYPPLSNTIKMLAELGYSAVEGYGGVMGSLNDVQALQADLNAAGLKMRTAHVGLDPLEKDPQTLIDMAKIVGAENLYVPFILPDDRPTTAKGWSEFGERLERAGKPIRDAGMGYGYHNHDFEFATTDGIVPMEAILEGGPSLEWEIDVAWVVRGNTDPLPWIERYKDRITAVHVKDIAAVGECVDEDGWADVGHGVMNWAGLMAALRDTKAKHFVMEHDNPSDERRFASRSLLSAKSY